MEHGVVVIFAFVCCRMNLSVTVVCLLMLNVLVSVSGNNNNYYCNSNDTTIYKPPYNII